MKRKNIWIEELENGEYTLIICTVNNAFGYENVPGFEAYLKKKDFGDVQFLIGVEKTIHYPTIEDFKDFVIENLDVGNFFYLVQPCDSHFVDVYDKVAE